MCLVAPYPAKRATFLFLAYPVLGQYGPPPAYPNLKIPGVNIPIPQHVQQDDLGQGGLFKDENDFTVYADCHGLNKAIYEKR